MGEILDDSVFPPLPQTVLLRGVLTDSHSPSCLFSYGGYYCADGLTLLKLGFIALSYGVMLRPFDYSILKVYKRELSSKDHVSKLQ